MHSNKYDYDYGQRRPQSSRGSRPLDEDDRREEWKEPPKSSIREAYEKYLREGHNVSERVSTSDYGEPYSRAYNSDTDWRNERTSSHERNAPEKRRRTLEDDDQYRYSHEPGDSYRQSPENYSHRNKDFKPTMLDELSRRRTPEESRYSQPQDEFHYNEYKKDSYYRPVTEFYQDRDSRERSRSPQRTRPREDFMKSYSPPRQRGGSFSRDHEDQNHNRTRFSMNGSSRLREQSHRRLSPPPPPPPPAAAAGEKKMSKGFQRFLDVLNMGVNMDTLTKIVTQGSPDVKPSSPPHINPWTESSQRQNPQHWPQTETRHQRDWSSYSSNGKTMSGESSLEDRHYEKKCPSPTINTPSSDEEHKRQQVHDVLQAIGIKLEFEELGQMSSRIQERLYGKKQPEITPSNNQIEDEEREKRRRAYAPKRHSRSSSGSSSGGSCQNYKKSHSYSAQWEDRDLSYQQDSRGTLQSAQKYPARVSPPALEQKPNKRPIPPPVLPPPSPITNWPPPPYIPPNLPFAMPNMFMPPPPPLTSPYLPYLPIPPPNIFPPTGPLRAPVPQQPNKNRNPPKRHRCLQQVPTKE